MRTPDGQKYGPSFLEETGYFLRSLKPVIKAGMLHGIKTPVSAVKNLDFAIRYGFSTARQLESAASRAPEQIALYDDDGQRTYEEMRQDVRAFARSMQQRYGIGKGSKVGILARNGRGMIYPLSSKGYLGFDVYLLNAGASPFQTRAIIEEHELNAILIDEEFVPFLEGGVGKCQPIITWAQDYANVQRPSDQWPTMQELIDQAPAASQEKLPHYPHVGKIITMSSGTTGTPKGVIRSELRSPKIAGGVVEILPWRPGLVVQLTAAMFHAWGWANVNLAMATLSTIVARRNFEPHQAYDDIKKYNVNAIVSAAARLKALLEVIEEEAPDPDFHPENMKFIVSSGNAIQPDITRGLQKVFGNVVSNFYGSTEISVVSLARGEDMAKYPTTAGTPMLGVKIKILDEKGKEVPQGQTGRIFAVNSLTLQGYTNPRDKVTVEQGLVEIGDKGYISDEGLLFVEGRADDMIIIGGENLYPKSVEECLSGMDGVRDMYVDGVADDETIQRVRAYIVPEREDGEPKIVEDDVRAYVRDHFADFAEPRDVYFMDELPRNEAGKVEWRKLPDQIIDK